METTSQTLRHLRPTDYRVIGPEQFGTPGLVARESLGPLVSVQALGVLVTVHDSTFEPHKGIGHHPHQGMERLFYILDGAVDHDDALNHIQGRMGHGDLGILTEGARGMIHSEWNHTDERTRTYIFVYPTSPTPPTAAFDAIRDDEAPRTTTADGVTTKHVVQRGEDRLHGDFRELGDHRLDGGAAVELDLQAGEAGLVFVIDGQVEVGCDSQAVDGVATEHTVLVPPSDADRMLRLTATSDSRVLHAVTGPGYGLVTADLRDSGEDAP